MSRPSRSSENGVETPPVFGRNVSGRLVPTSRPERGEKPFKGLLLAGALVSTLAVVAIFAFLAWFALPLFSGDGLAAVLSGTWRPRQGQFCVLPMLAGSLLLGISATVLAYPTALGLCCFVHGLGPARLAKPLLLLIRFMTGMPTVVYGFAAVFLLVPLIRETLGGGSGFCLLTAALVLALLVLPTMVLFIEAQFAAIEPRIRLTCEALGLGAAQRLVRLTLPLSRRGLLAAAVLGFGRAMGDAVIALMLSGNAPQWPHSPLDAIRTLSAHIALVLATDSQSPAYRSLFAAGLLLFAASALTNLALRRLGAAKNGEAGRVPI